MADVAIARVIADMNADLAKRPSTEVASLLDGADDWAISIGAGQFLHQLVKHVAPASVLEFGAGRSSLVIASALQSNGGGRLTSV